MSEDRNYDYEIEKALDTAPGDFVVSDESGWSDRGEGRYQAEVTLEPGADIDAIVDHLKKELPDCDVWSSAPGESEREFTITIEVPDEEDG